MSAAMLQSFEILNGYNLEHGTRSPVTCQSYAVCLSVLQTTFHPMAGFTSSDTMNQNAMSIVRQKIHPTPPYGRLARLENGDLGGTPASARATTPSSTDLGMSCPPCRRSGTKSLSMLTVSYEMRCFWQGS